MDRTTVFSRHVDECQQCKSHPFELCNTGQNILHDIVVNETEEFFTDGIAINTEENI